MALRTQTGVHLSEAALDYKHKQTKNNEITKGKVQVKKTIGRSLPFVLLLRVNRASLHWSEEGQVPKL